VKPARDPGVDYCELVRRGYDGCAPLYAARRREDDSDQLAPLLRRLSPGSKILDLGCGAGVPLARVLAEEHEVTGVDISEKMLALARESVPGARFLRANVLECDLPPRSFDAALAVFVLFHLPRERHAEFIGRVRTWLRPGAYFLLSVTESAEESHTEEDFFGGTMYWSHYGRTDYLAMLRGVGFEILEERIIGHGYGRRYRGADERHPLVLARRPDGS
jgi:cyclopropane fatty-acyl-phospholipid synthase-like methyltransferase